MANDSAVMNTQVVIEIFGNNIFRTIAVLPSIPPSCTILSTINKNINQMLHFAFPNLGPGSLLKACIAVSPDMMVCFPNSSWTATFTKQLTMMIQNAANPALAPSVVVAISSPDPTMEADKIKPGPRNLSFWPNDVGGSLILWLSIR